MATTPPLADPVTGDRYYQVRAVENIRKSIASGKRRIIVVSPTGSGKMRVIARIMQLAAAKGNRAGFAAHARELVEQNEKTLESLGSPCHVVMSGRENEYRNAAEAEEALLCPVMAKGTLWARVFSKRAANNRLRFDAPDLDVLLFDEAHLSLAKTWLAIADHYKDKILIGFTATPCRTDGRGLGILYDDMVTMATYSELQEYGYLVPLRIIAPSRPDLSRLKVNAGDYQKGQLEKRMNKKKLVGNVVKTWVAKGEGRSTVVFASGVDHSKSLRDEFRAAGVTAEHVDGKTDLVERAEIMEKARSGEVLVMCNYGVATMGVDVPRWKCMVCCRPTKSLGLWWQMAGRVQRPSEDFQDALILDHSDNALVFGFPDEDVDWSLQDDTKVQDRQALKKKKETVRRCPKCSSVVKTNTCSSCGYVFPPPVVKPVESTSHELVEMARSQRNRTYKRDQKQAYWNKMLNWARYRGYKTAAASCRYREFFGVWPKGLAFIPRDNHQSQMPARHFYETYVVPAKERNQRVDDLFGWDP